MGNQFDADHGEPGDTIGNALTDAVDQHDAARGYSVDAGSVHSKPQEDVRWNWKEDREAEKVAAREAAERSRQQRAAADPESSTNSHDRRPAADSVSTKVQSATSRSDERQPTAGKAETETSEIPDSWSAKDREAFNRLTSEGREFVLRQHNEHADFKREYQPVDKMFEPYRDRMSAGGWTAPKLIEAWMNVEKRLMEGDGVNVLAGLTRAYGIDINHVAHALGLRPRQQLTDASGHLPPAVAQQLQRIQGRLDNDDRARADHARRAQAENEQRVMREVETFKSAKDGKGNLLYPHFGELENEMAQIAHLAILGKKPVPSLKDLYETALWATPATREKALAARSLAQPAKAAGNAKPAPARARGNGSERSLRDEIAAAIGG